MRIPQQNLVEKPVIILQTILFADFTFIGIRILKARGLFVLWK